MQLRLAIATLLILLALATGAAANVGWPLTSQTVYDPNHVLNQSERERVAESFDELSHEVGVELVGVLVNSFDGEEPRRAIERLIEAWSLGSRTEGIGVVVAMDHFDGKLYVVATDRAQQWLSKSKLRRLEQQGNEFISERRYESAMLVIGATAIQEFRPDDSQRHRYSPSYRSSWLYWVVIIISIFARMAFWGYGGFFGRGWYGGGMGGWRGGVYDLHGYDGFGGGFGWNPFQRRRYFRDSHSRSSGDQRRTPDRPVQDPRYRRGGVTTTRYADDQKDGADAWGEQTQAKQKPRPLRPEDNRWKDSGSSSGGW